MSTAAAEITAAIRKSLRVREFSRHLSIIVFAMPPNESSRLSWRVILSREKREELLALSRRQVAYTDVCKSSLFQLDLLIESKQRRSGSSSSSLKRQYRMKYLSPLVSSAEEAVAEKNQYYDKSITQLLAADS
jgi:hypothetical protein